MRGRVVGIGVGEVREAPEAFRSLELQRMDEPNRPASLLREIRQSLAGGRAAVLRADHGGQPQDRIDMVGAERGEGEIVAPRPPALAAPLEEPRTLVEFGRSGGRPLLRGLGILRKGAIGRSGGGAPLLSEVRDGAPRDPDQGPGEGKDQRSRQAQGPAEASQARRSRRVRRRAASR